MTHRRTDSEPNDGLHELRYHLFEGRYAAAIAELESFAPDVRQRGDIQNVKAVCLLHLGKHMQAIKVLDEVLLLDPGDDAARHNRLECLFNICEARMEAANKRFLAGDAGGALACYDLVPSQHLEELRPGHPQLLYTYYNNRGAVFMKLERFAAALGDFDTAVGLRPGRSDAHHNRGVSLKAMKRYREALVAFDACLRVDGRAYSALCGKSEVLAALDMFNEAIDVASRAIEVNDTPDNYRALLSRGFARLKNGEYGGSVRDLEAAEHRGCASNEFIQMYELALALHGDELSEIGEYELAIDLYERALGMGSSEQPSVDLLYNLTLAKLYSGDTSDEPANGFRHVLSLRPTHTQAAAALGMHLLEVSTPNSPDAEEAVTWLRLATDLRPNGADVHYHYGLALMKVGNMKAAGDAFRKVLEIDPKHQMASDGLSRVEGFSAGFAVAAAVARRQSMAISGGRMSDNGGYTPVSPKLPDRRSRRLPDGTERPGSSQLQASEIMAERTLQRTQSRGQSSIRSSMTGEDMAESYPISPRAEIAYLKEQLLRRQDLIDALQRQVEDLKHKLTTARQHPEPSAAAPAKDTVKGRHVPRRSSITDSPLFKGPAAYPEEHKKGRRRSSELRVKPRVSEGSERESGDGSILVEPSPRGSVRTGLSHTGAVTWGFSSEVSGDGMSDDPARDSTITATTYGDMEGEEIVGPFYQENGVKMSDEKDMDSPPDVPPLTSPMSRRFHHSRRSLSRKGSIPDEYTPSVSVSDVRSLDNTSTEDALIDMRFPLNALQSPGPFPPGINIQERERYLTDKDFDDAFKVNRVEYSKLSKWRRLAMKKELGLW